MKREVVEAAERPNGEKEQGEKFRGDGEQKKSKSRSSPSFAKRDRVRDDTTPAWFLVALLFVIERFAVGAYLDFRFLPVRFDLSLVGHQLVFLGEGLDFQDFSSAGLGLQSRFDFWREGIERNLLFDFDDGTVGGHGNVLAVAVDGHFDFVEDLALFFLCRESANGCSRTLRCHCLFNGRRKVGALDFLFLGGGGSCKK